MRRNDTTDPIEIRINPAIHGISDGKSGTTRTFMWKPVDNAPSPDANVDIGADGRRHSGQSIKEGQFSQSDPKAQFPFPPIDPKYCFRCYQVDEEAKKVKSIDGHRVFQNHLYLFNIIVAVEWTPSLRTIQELRLAAQRASNFLFDVTDGYMAIGQVLIGGRDLMHVADIQLMASNRLHPRSWVAALHYAGKFQPLRVGRGLWSKNHNFVITWDEPTGYRALVHEWGHYALGLADDYLSPVGVACPAGKVWKLTGRQDDSGLSIVVPNIGIAVESIMSTLEASELIPQGEGTRVERRKRVFERIQRYFGYVDPEIELQEGPAALPIDAPIFPQPLPTEPGMDLELSLNASLPKELDLEVDSPSNCWAYVLKKYVPEKGVAAAEPPTYIIAQGTFLARVKDAAIPNQARAALALAGLTPPRGPDEDTFRLLGAEAGDSVVLMRQVGGQLRVVGRAVANNNGNLEFASDQEWLNVSPDSEDLPLFVDVLPELLNQDEAKDRPPGAPPWIADVKVQIETRGRKPDDVYLYFYGQNDRKAEAPPIYLNQVKSNADTTRWHSLPIPSLGLDGHVLLRWKAKDSNDTARMLICGFSQSGGPGTSGGGYLPITAGSADGNVMVFFRENSEPLRYPNESGPSVAKVVSEEKLRQDLYVRIVTTTMTWGKQQLPSGAVARSYVFSLASNESLQKYPATLVFYFDKNAPRRDGDLLVHRWCDDAGWQPLTTYIPADQQYVGVPLDREAPEAAGQLIKDDQQPNGERKPSFERYRVYWTP